MKLKNRIFCYYKGHGYFWFRIFGYGIHYKRVSITGLSFTERTLNTGFQIGDYRFKLLKGWGPEMKNKN